LSSIDLILSALDFIVTEALTALAKPEEILPLVFSSVCNWGKTVQPSVTVTRQILSLDSNLDNSDVVDNFNLDYFDDDHIPLSGTIGSSPALAERNHSYCNRGINSLGQT
jgi:hypothetical protein